MFDVLPRLRILPVLLGRRDRRRMLYAFVQPDRSADRRNRGLPAGRTPGPDRAKTSDRRTGFRVHAQLGLGLADLGHDAIGAAAMGENRTSAVAVAEAGLSKATSWAVPKTSSGAAKKTSRVALHFIAILRRKRVRTIAVRRSLHPRPALYHTRS